MDQNISVSLVIATYNSERTLDQSLTSIAAQNYPMKLVEIIIADGGSSDKTLKIARKYKSKIVQVPQDKQNAEYNKGVGLQKAKNDIVIFLDHDNILPHSAWLHNMIQPFIQNPKIVGVEPLRFHHDRKMSILDRYFALIGGPDPVPFYFGKNSHLSYAYDSYRLLGDAADMGDYYVVKFSKDRIPALGGNGAAVRRELLLKYAKSSPDTFFHIDVQVDLIKKGYNTYGIIKDSVIHLTNNKFFPFIKRRKYFIEKYHFEDKSKRRYSVYEPGRDRINLIKYILLSSTLVIPTYDAIRGFMKVRDFAWFIHPFMCVSMLVAYGIPTIRQEVKRVVLAR